MVGSWQQLRRQKGVLIQLRAAAHHRRRPVWIDRPSTTHVLTDPRPRPATPTRLPRALIIVRRRGYSTGPAADNNWVSWRDGMPHAATDHQRRRRRCSAVFANSFYINHLSSGIHSLITRTRTHTHTRSLIDHSIQRS